MGRVAIEVPKPHVDQPIGAICGQHQGKLLNQPSSVSRGDLGRRTTAVVGHLFVTIYMDTSGVGNPLRSPVLKDRLGSAHIMKVRVQNGHDRTIGHLAQFGDCFTHFFG